MPEIPVNAPLEDGLLLDVSGGSGALKVGEGVAFDSTGAFGVLISEGAGQMRVALLSAVLPDATDVVTGQESGATRNVDGIDDEAVSPVNPDGSDYAENDGTVVLWIVNGEATGIVARVRAQRAVEGQLLDRTRYVAPGQLARFGTFARDLYNIMTGANAGKVQLIVPVSPLIDLYAWRTPKELVR